MTCGPALFISQPTSPAGRKREVLGRKCVFFLLKDSNFCPEPKMLICPLQKMLANFDNHICETYLQIVIP